MAIVVTVDKRSELEWLLSVIETGVMNMSPMGANRLKSLGIDLKHNVNYKPSEIYEEDITEQIKNIMKPLQRKETHYENTCTR